MNTTIDELKDYFTTVNGTGILATASPDGQPNGAVYARPHFMEDGRIAFIMRDRQTHANIKTNPYAAYVFIEEGSQGKGKRLYLTMTDEDDNEERINSLARRKYKSDKTEKRFLVFFTVDRVRPLIGGGIA